MRTEKRTLGCIVAILLIISVFGSIALAQDQDKETFYLNNYLEREFEIHRNIATFDIRFGEFKTWDYNVYYYRRTFEINQQLYDNIRKLILTPRDRIKLTDRVFFSIHNKYIPGFMQLYTMPIAKPPKKPNLIYKKRGY